MLLKYVKKIEDNRRKQGQRFQLHYIIFFSILAILCGAEGYMDIQRFIEVHFKKLNRKFRLKWKKRDKKDDTGYYIATTILPARKMSKIIRNHWGIENKNHYVKDVSLKEDISRIRISAEIFATFRGFALNTLRANESQNIKGYIYCNTLDLSNCFRLKGIG